MTRHFAVSTALGGLAYLGTGSVGTTLSAWASGWLIDLDHLLDYSVEHGLRPDPAYFFSTFSNDRYRKARLVLHGWEWALVLACLSWCLGGEPVTAGLAFGWTQHLLFDQFTNRTRPLTYSLVARALKGFDYQQFFPPARRHE